MKDNVVIKKSEINGKGLFAGRDFKKGEIILRWNPKLILKDEIEKLTKKERNYVYFSGSRYYLMQSPERFVNYSCNPNTFVKDFCDVAVRDIAKGEEITTAHEENFENSFECTCGSEKCRKLLGKR